MLTSEMDYDPWYDASNPDQVDWKKLGLARRKVAISISDAKNNWHLERVKLEEACGGQSGLYLADFSSPEIVADPGRMWAYRPHRRVLANVTDLGVLLKAGTSSGLVWVTSMSTGKPVAGASVQIYSPRGKVVWSGSSDERGLAMLPGTTRLLGQPGPADEAEARGDGQLPRQASSPGEKTATWPRSTKCSTESRSGLGVAEYARAAPADPGSPVRPRHLRTGETVNSGPARG